MTSAASSDPHGIRAVLGEGARLFVAGLPTVFPWILGAELLQLLPFAGQGGGIFDTDLELLGRPDFLVRALFFGLAQAMLYAIAVLRMAALASEAVPGKSGWNAVRAVPSVVVAYLVYELAVAFGLMLAFVMFILGFFIAGPLFGLVLCVLPLAPTAAASTALALFMFPAVLERRGPFAALGESSRLAKTRWARVTLVISVPALALLAVWCVGHGPQMIHFASQYLDLVRKSQEEGGVSLEQMQGLLGGSKAAASAGRNGWQISSALLGAFAWWYTLAVCYAQYRDLKRTA